MPSGNLFKQNDAPWQGDLAVSGFSEVQNGLL